ncbi:MAG: hypothetical protein KAI76_05785 [Alphaproteobacteria bacterium]|nr:hypothetical protein [Alphaproteobacteria bacterium]
MTYQTITLTWQSIDFTLAFDHEYFTSCGIAHIEIYCNQPLPITETGYKSIFVPTADIADIKIAAALVLQTLTLSAQKTGWTLERQLSLF